MNINSIDKIIENHIDELGSLISILEDIQNEYMYLPEKALKRIALKTGKNLAEIYGVATFYKAFSLKPKGKHLISVCMGTACHVRGAQGIADEFSSQLELKVGETSEDREFTLETVNCLGTCALGPIVFVDGHYFSNVKRTDVKKIIQKTKKGFDDSSDTEKMIPLDVYCPNCSRSLIDKNKKIGNNPSITLKVLFENKPGWVSFSSLYGSNAFRFSHNGTPEGDLEFFCPHCSLQLTGSSNCIECGSPIIPLMIKGGGVLRLCVRHGCNNRVLDLSAKDYHACKCNCTKS